MHALFFAPDLFDDFPNNNKGETFTFKNSENIPHIRGDNIMKQVKEHYGCDTVESGIFFF